MSRSSSVAKHGTWGPDYFPFTQSSCLGTDSNLADVSFLDDQEAGSIKRVIIKNGHFYYEGTETRVRFFGTNLCFGHAFPPKNKADSLAKRLKQLGINVVRFHHMDNRDIFEKSNPMKLDEDKLDKLHYFLYYLSKNHIYANINLHVSRLYPDPDYSFELQQVFHMGKVLDRFYEPYIQMQTQYASHLLNSYNKYSGFKLSEDPVVAFVELNNENSIFLVLDKLEIIKETKYYKYLEDKWHCYLKSKYGSFKNIDARYNPCILDLSHNLSVNKIFYFQFEENKGAKSTNLANDKEFKYEIDIVNEGSYSWAYQAHLIDIKLECHTDYTIVFRGKAVPNRTISLYFQENEASWMLLSKNHQHVELTEETKEFKVELYTIKSFDTKKQLRFSFGLNSSEIGKIYLSEVAIYRGRERISISHHGTINEIQIPTASSFPSDFLIHSDFRLFLNEIETQTQNRLIKHVKDKLKFKGNLTDSQANLGTINTFAREATNSDYVDVHAYWQHPQFAEGHSWDRRYYWIENTAMVDSKKMGEFYLNFFHCKDKPFTVSEYNHPFPNENQHETLPILSSWAAYHDWDAIYQFDYSPSYDIETNFISSYFSMSENPVLMILAPFAALAFRKFYVSESNDTSIVKIPINYINEKNETGIIYWWNIVYSQQFNNIGKNLRIEFVDDPSMNDITIERNQKINEDISYLYKTSSIEWKLNDGQNGIYTVNTDYIKYAVGHLMNKINWDSFTVEVERKNSKDTTTVAISSLDLKELDLSEKILIAVVGKARNTGQQWDDNRTTTSKSWGKAPVCVEFIKFKISFVSIGSDQCVIVLNNNGEPNGTLELKKEESQMLSFSNDEKNPSLWFLLTRKV